MNWFPKKRAKERERFYLLAGQGGKEYRRKRMVMIIWSIIFALGLSATMAAAFYLMNRPPH